MAPKRKEKDQETSSKSKPDPIQVDNELFLQAFEKPTQIYRYLRNRNLLQPIFLHRNLSYMKGRFSRSHKNRKDFKIDTLLTRVQEKERKPNGLLLPGNYLSLMFLGFYDKQIEEVEQDQGQVKVEIVVIKNSHNRRKDTSTPAHTVIGTVNVMVNPNDISLGHAKIPAVSIPISKFDLDSPSPASYTLTFRIEHVPNSVLNCSANNGVEETDSKKRKISKIYSTELLIIDKSTKLLLEDGEYDLTVQDATNINYKFYSPKKLSGMTWENFEAPKYEYIDSENTEEFSYDDLLNKEPTLKFRLQWTKELLAGLVERPQPIICTEANKENQPNGCVNGVNNNNIVSIVDSKNNNTNKKPDPKVRIIYQFVYSNNSRQQTEPCFNLQCPWCSLNCLTLYALVKHLKLCHARFSFTYIQIGDTARIDVAINEAYDGSYIGAPHDLLHGFSRKAGPVKRSACSSVLVCHPRRTKPNLNEFLEVDENEFDSQRPYITGHNRLYHHTMTCLPVLPKELDIDSEGESDPNWLKYKTMQMIDEFTDVNEGEKELMKFWNLHVMKHGYVGDCQIPIALDMFLEEKGKALLTKNLYRNFILHLCSLFDFGLISPENFYTTVQKLQKILNESEECRLQMAKRHDEQSEYWKTVGIHRQIELQKQQAAAEAIRKREEAEKIKKEEKTLTITATDSIKASATLQGNKTVSASIRTSSTTTVSTNLNNNTKNGTANSNRDRKNSLSTNSSFTTHQNNTKQSNHSKSSANEHNRSALNKSGTSNGTGGSNNTRDRGLKRRLSGNNNAQVNAAKRRRSAGSIPTIGTHNIPAINKTLASVSSRRRSVAVTPLSCATNELLPKNFNPKIVLTRKSIASSTVGTITMRTRTSSTNAGHHK